MGLCLRLSTASYAQIGINTPADVSPTQDMEVYTRNGFRVQQKYQLVAGDPNANVTIMANGVNPPALSAVQALIHENEVLKARLTQQEARLQQSEQHVRQINARLDALEAGIVPRRRESHR